MGVGGWGHFFGLLEDYISNLSLFRSLEPFKKFVVVVVVVVVGGWLRVILVLSLSFKLNNTYSKIFISINISSNIVQLEAQAEH